MAPRSPNAMRQANTAATVSFDNSGQALNAVVPRWVSAQWVSGGFQLTGLGGPLLAYQVLASTNLPVPNWTVVGTVTADASGALQFLHPLVTGSGNRFYRLAR
jgi:hypothetical protein